MTASFWKTLCPGIILVLSSGSVPCHLKVCILINKNIQTLVLKPKKKKCAYGQKIQTKEYPQITKCWVIIWVMNIIFQNNFLFHAWFKQNQVIDQSNLDFQFTFRWKTDHLLISFTFLFSDTIKVSHIIHAFHN